MTRQELCDWVAIQPMTAENVVKIVEAILDWREAQQAQIQAEMHKIYDYAIKCQTGTGPNPSGDMNA